MIDFSLTEEQLEIQRMAKEFAEKEVKPLAAEYDRRVDPAECFPWDIYRKANRLGFNKILIDKKYGGLGLGEIEACLVIEELSVADAGVGTMYFVSDSLCRWIADVATEDQRQRFLPELCADDAFVGVADTEHGAAGDLSPREFRAGRAAVKEITAADFATTTASCLSPISYTSTPTCSPSI